MNVRVSNVIERPDPANRWREFDELWPLMHFDPDAGRR
jgi:hypothetical protein